MTIDLLIQLLFEEHWLLTTFLAPSLAMLYAAVTGSFAWAFGCVAVMFGYAAANRALTK